MSDNSGAAGYAALAICESTLLSLTENAIINDAEARSILADAAAAHRNAILLATEGSTVPHEAAAALIEAILAGGNSMRRI